MTGLPEPGTLACAPPGGAPLLAARKNASQDYNITSECEKKSFTNTIMNTPSTITRKWECLGLVLWASRDGNPQFIPDLLQRK